MSKKIVSVLSAIALVLLLVVTFAPSVVAQVSRVFTSAQVGLNPVDGYCLTTNGATSTWAACGGGGGSSKWDSIGGFLQPTITYINNIVRATAFTATSTTATSTFAGPVALQGWILSTTTVVCMAPEKCQFQSTGGYDAIQRAINYATSTGGGIVYVKKGTYTGTERMFMGSNVVLRGEGQNATILETTYAGGPFILGRKVSNVVIEDIGFYNESTNVNGGVFLSTDDGSASSTDTTNWSKNVTLRNLRIHSPGGLDNNWHFGFQIHYTKNYTAENITIEGVDYGAEFERAHDGTITNSRVGVVLYGIAGSTGQLRRLVISNNNIYPYDGITLSQGIRIEAGSDIIINGNTIIDATGYGGITLGVQGTSAGIVSNNTITDSKRCIEIVEDSHNISIDGNRCQNTQYGINLLSNSSATSSDVIITDNFINSWYYPAVDLEDGVSDVMINSNQFLMPDDASGDGVSSVIATGDNVNNVTISNNQFKGVLKRNAATHRVIELESKGLRDFVVTGNYAEFCDGSVANTAYFAFARFATDGIQNAVFSDNVTNTYVPVSDTCNGNQEGIKLENATTTSITDNVFVGSIVIDTPDSSTNIFNNKTSDNSSSYLLQSLGINTASPDRQLEVLSSGLPQLRLSHTDSSVFTDFETTSLGFLHLSPSGERIGIGTSTPQSLLSLSNNNPIIELFDTSATDLWRVRNQNGEFAIYPNTDSATPPLSITSTGAVGFDVASPATKFDIGLMSGFQQRGTIRLSRTDSTTRFHEIGVFNDSTPAGNFIDFALHTGTVSATTSVLRLNGAGSVGIGTTSPSARLTVSGDMRLTGRFADSASSTGAVGSVLTATATGTAWVATSSLGIAGSVSGPVYLASSTGWTVGGVAHVNSNGALGSTATGTLTETITGLNLSATRALIGGAAILALDAGYTVPTTTLITSASSFFANPSSLCVSITGSADLCDGSDATGGGGGSQTPWTSNIDGAGYSLSNVGTTTVTSLDIGTTTATGSQLEVQSSVLGGIIARFFGSTGSTTAVISQATTTVRHSSLLPGFLQASLARITVGIEAALGYYKSGRLFGALTIKGLFYQEEWNQVDCSSVVGAVAIIADGLTGCDGFAFYEDNTATLTSTADGGNIYGRLSTSAANDGAGIFLNAPTAGGLFLATSTPVFEATVRIHSVQNQGTTTQTFIGFSNIASAGTTYETAPTAGCFFTASTTIANWRAICRTSLGAQTNVDTGIASTTVTTGNGVPYRFMIEADTTGAKFYIQSSEAGSLNQVAHIVTTVPTTTAMNAGVHFGRVSGVTAVGVDVYDMNIGWRKFLGW